MRTIAWDRGPWDRGRIARCWIELGLLVGQSPFSARRLQHPTPGLAPDTAGRA